VEKIIVSVGEKIAVGQSIATLASASGAAPPPAATTPASRPVTPRAAPLQTIATPLPVPEEPEVSLADAPSVEEDVPGLPPPPAAPSLRRIARELGINLRKIRGSERGGRIIMADVRAYIARLEKLAARPAPAAIRPGGAPAVAPVERIDFAKWGPVVQKPMTPLRKIIAERMTASAQTVPQVTQFEWADITALNDLRKKYADAYDKQGARLTITSFALKIVANALKKFPLFNASLDETTQEIVFKDYIHIGLAVDTDQGLIVPVIRNVDQKDLLALSKDVAEFAAKTRDRKVSLDELQGGTFTISNQGGIGGGHFTPIVNKPEVAILGMGRGAMQAVVRDGKIEPRLMLPIALTYDHRLIDGGAAARFAVELVQGFERFSDESVKL
jgi:pyruvate dehydrogenase E2 component (dihydrolipoamide acetyltransferase)